MEGEYIIPLPSGPHLQTPWVVTASISTLDEEIWLVRQYLCHISRRRNRAHNPLLRLPPELLCLIMDDLVDISQVTLETTSRSPQRDLQTCSLVCSTLLPYARARILPYIRLDEPDAFLNAVYLFRDILPELHSQPRIISLTDKWEETGDWTIKRADDPQWDELRPSIAYMLQGLTSVKQLHIQNTDYEVDQPTLLFSASGQLTVPTWSHISHLTLEGCEFDYMRTLLNLVLQFSSLAALELLHCGILERTHLEPGPQSQKLALNRLQVIQNNTPGERFFSAEDYVFRLSEYLLPDSLHELECDLPQTPKGSILLRTILQIFGGTLQKIHVHLNTHLRHNFEQALENYSDLIAALSSYAPNVLSVTHNVPWALDRGPFDCIVSLLEQTRLGNLHGISILLPDTHLNYFHFTCENIARIARATRDRVRIKFDERADSLDLEPDEDWQQRHRVSSSVIRHVAQGPSFVVARDVYEFEGEGDECVLVHLERTAVHGFMRKFHALEFVRCDPSLAAQGTAGTA